MKYEALKRLFEILGYPQWHYENVKSQLERLGVEDVIEDGDVTFFGVRLVGKGQNSLVFKCVHNGQVVLCKIRRFDASRDSLIHEAKCLEAANSVGVGPRIYGYDKDVIVREFINGIPIRKFVEICDADGLRKVVRELLLQCHQLDRIRLAHNELNRLGEHVIVTHDLRPYIIDFESATLNSKTSNVAQAIAALIMAPGKLQMRVRELLGIKDEQLLGIREAIRRYKERRCEDVLWEILKLLNIA